MNKRDQQFIEAMGAVVAEVGRDFVYPDEHRTEEDQCLYVFDGRPSCLIGRALAHVGVPLWVIESHEGSNAASVMETLGFDPAVFNAADWAQQQQDDRKTWGEALDKFREALTNAPLWY